MSATTNESLVVLLRRRTWAGWIDVLLLFAVALMISAITGNAHVGSWTTTVGGFADEHKGVSINLPSWSFLLWIVVALCYYAFAEATTGQTVGKRMLGLKVIMVNGGPLTTKAVGLRTIGRLIDVLPLFYLVGWIAMRGPHQPPQRLGDRAAGTTVVPISHP